MKKLLKIFFKKLLRNFFTTKASTDEHQILMKQ